VVTGRSDAPGCERQTVSEGTLDLTIGIPEKVAVISNVSKG
jgi:hypothetical protein